MERVWLDTNVTALYAINLSVAEDLTCFEPGPLGKVNDNHTIVLLVGVGNRLEIYMPYAKVRYI